MVCHGGVSRWCAKMVCHHVHVHDDVHVSRCTADRTWGDNWLTIDWQFRMLFQSSKLKAPTTLLPRFNEKRISSFELCKSFRKCHPTWDWLYLCYVSRSCVEMCVIIYMCHHVRVSWSTRVTMYVCLDLHVSRTCALLCYLLVIHSALSIGHRPLSIVYSPLSI